VTTTMEKMSHSFALDPFSTVARIALLPYMDQGVKIGIYKNTIVFHQPTVADWLRRSALSWFTQGCTKHGLFHLRVPMERATLWYAEKVPSVFEMTREGLDRLESNYGGSGNVCETIASISRSIQHTNQIVPEDMSNKPSLQRLKTSWSDQELEAICKLFTLLRKEKSAFIVECIEEFIRGKEPSLLDIIREPTI
jgi:hypothetical protein